MRNGIGGRVHDYHNMKYTLSQSPSIPKSIIEWSRKKDEEVGLLWIGWIDRTYYRLTCKDLQLKAWTMGKDYVTWVETKLTKEIIDKIKVDKDN
jgi:hypothetical protein